MFSTQARWDRRMPAYAKASAGRPSDPDDLQEKIWVSALFKAGKILPRYFIWNNRTFRVKEITYAWQKKAGEDLLNCFSVNTACGLYQISFSQKNLSWRMDRIIS